jgi:N5-(cytidine 5'-diphosphoramidyl)-L-glutamine hydrolase
LKSIAITQRVAVVPGYGERRDCLDQAWPRFLAACGLLPVIVPNIPELALALCAKDEVDGLVLTGGNDLVSLGGEAPERDATENALVDMAEAKGLPVLGVCRGMQVLQQRSGVRLTRVEGHVLQRQVIDVEGTPVEVNSYHGFGACESQPPLEVWAVAEDGVVKAVRHSTRRSIGIMWHPERRQPFAAADMALFRDFFQVS